ncbi:translation initiation factor IF3-1, mitochondrial [Jatropha curcas]|uniref:translation initiation factor IF3-1, mitochondrial n=1 Tax=Jatropha curcas TaxID=180498 RepID=UPI001892DDCB|nr:translation initiation factor IF3-1, mitochondrial [Jatropha curcas]
MSGGTVGATLVVDSLNAKSREGAKVKLSLKDCNILVPYTEKKWLFVENQTWDVCKIRTDFCNSARSFATSFQAKAKKEEKENGGRRLNEQIKAQFVRLVKDEGHMVIPLREALAQARSLKLDLVEVQRGVDPPVCKIMDFDREKYKQYLKEKDRAKSKPELTIRKGDVKEVRFSEKTEQKDLQNKADAVIRLMQRGYRVKCMVTSSVKKRSGGALKKGSGDKDLTEEEIAEQRKQEEEEREKMKALLSRLTALIEDECYMETGLMVRKQQAYVIVRHIKFGPSKKGSTKKVMDVDKVAAAKPTDEDDLPYKKLGDDKTAWSVVDSDDESDRIFDLSDDAKKLNINCAEEEIMKGPPEADSSHTNFYIPNLSHPRPPHGSKQTDRPLSSPQTFAAENRYKRSEPMEQFSPSIRDNRLGPDKTGSFSFEPRLSRRSENSQSQKNTTPSMGVRDPIRTDSSSSRNIKLPPAEMLKQDSNLPDAAATRRSSYGIFSSTKATTPEKQGLAAEDYKSSKSDGSRRTGDDGNSGQGKWGIFSNNTPQANSNRVSK